MRYHVSRFARMVIALSVLFPFSSLVSAEETNECKALTATGNSEYPPFLWRASEKNDVLMGANSRIIDEISRRLGIPIRLIHTGPWSRAQLEVKTGRVDLMAGAFYTDERTEYMDYLSPAFLYTSSVIWKRRGQTLNYHDKKDLIGKSGVTVINNSFGQSFDEFAAENLSILSVASLEQAFRMLIAGRVDYAIYEKSPGIAYQELLSLQEGVEPIAPSISSEGLYLTISKNSPCNTPELKQTIANILQDMSSQGINDKALTDGFTDWQVFPKPM